MVPVFVASRWYRSFSVSCFHLRFAVVEWICSILVPLSVAFGSQLKFNWTVSKMELFASIYFTTSPFMSSRSFWAVGFFEALSGILRWILCTICRCLLLRLHTLPSDFSICAHLRYEDGQSIAWILVHNVVVTRIVSPFTRWFFFRHSCYSRSLPQQLSTHQKWTEHKMSNWTFVRNQLLMEHYDTAYWKRFTQNSWNASHTSFGFQLSRWSNRFPLCPRNF